MPSWVQVGTLTDMDGFGELQRFLVTLIALVTAFALALAAVFVASLSNNAPDGPSPQEQRATIDAVQEGRSALSPGEVRVPRRLTVDVDTAIVLEVYVSPAGARCASARELDDTPTSDSSVGGYVRVVPRMDAPAEIVAVSPEEQPVLAPGDCGRWEFLVTPHTPGPQTVFVGVSTLHGFDDEVLETTTVRVSVNSEPTLGYYVGLYGPVLLQVLGALGAVGIGFGLWRRRERQKADDLYFGSRTEIGRTGAAADDPVWPRDETEPSRERIRRWLARPAPEPASLAEDLETQMDNGAWVDRALSNVAASDPYDALIDEVADRRRVRDRAAAMRLAGEADGSALLIEDVRDKVVHPWETATGSVLLVVMDFMTAADATRIADQLASRGLVEWVPGSGRRQGKRLVTLPMLPPIPRNSLPALLGAPLRTSKVGGGMLFADAARPRWRSKDLFSSRAVDLVSSDIGVVHLILRHDDSWATERGYRPDRLRHHALTWDLSTRPVLAEFLETAATHGRTIILTSTGGHMFTPQPSAPTDRRWRSSEASARPAEVLVAGPRVHTSTRQALLTWRTSDGYGGTPPGGIGGGSLAEVAVPILVFQGADGTAPPDWEPCGDPKPSWWTGES